MGSLNMLARRGGRFGSSAGLSNPQILMVVCGVVLVAMLGISFMQGGSGPAKSSSASYSSATSASSSGASSADATSVSAAAKKPPVVVGTPYTCEYFKLSLPSGWDVDKCEIIHTEETREAMNATNHEYHFKYDKMAQFTIRCTLFDMDGSAAVGKSSNGYQIEFHPEEWMDADDERFVRSSIKPL